MQTVYLQALIKVLLDAVCIIANLTTEPTKMVGRYSIMVWGLRPLTKLQYWAGSENVLPINKSHLFQIWHKLTISSLNLASSLLGENIMSFCEERRIFLQVVIEHVSSQLRKSEKRSVRSMSLYIEVKLLWILLTAEKKEYILHHPVGHTLSFGGNCQIITLILELCISKI